jgi:hypothetical protein
VILSAERTRPLRTYFLALSLAAFVLNWVWEMAQMPAFAELAGLVGYHYWNDG